MRERAAWRLRALLAALALGLAPAAQGATPDADGDAVADFCDNCRLHPNADQRDTNRDGFGNRCDADFDGDGLTNFADLAVLKARFFTPDPEADLSGDGLVNFLDLSLQKQLFFAPPGPGAVAAAVVEGSCDPATDAGCVDPFRPGACFDGRVAAFPTGEPRPWHVQPPSDGCDVAPEALVAAGFSAAAANPNNPTDAHVADLSLGATRCPNAAFATFDSGALCGPGQACDPADAGRPCGLPKPDGSFVACGDPAAPRACELLDACEGQCGYANADCAAQYRRNLVATCDALAGAERRECRSACLAFAALYADAHEGAGDAAVPGTFTPADLAKELTACRCCADSGPAGEPPARCGDGVCEARTETCHPSSCPEDCGVCALGTACITDGDCGVGRCSFEGVCEALPAGAGCGGDVACRSGACVEGACAATCGDGFCDGAERCGTLGPDACASDCGLCSNTEQCLGAADCESAGCSAGACLGRVPEAPCVAAAQCASGICDQGRCLEAPLGAGESCGLDLSCRGDFESTVLQPGEAGICDLGLCIDELKAFGSACERDAACQVGIFPNKFGQPVGVCNLGVCLAEAVAPGGSCDRDLACEWVCDAGNLSCAGICNGGTCLEERLPFGAACDRSRACEPDLLCAEGTCRKRAGEACAAGAECATGLCDPGAGKCISVCGDGLCDLRGAEICGPDDLLTCRSDCGKCGLVSGLLGAAGLCIADEDCATGICNFGFCQAGPAGPGSACSTNAACWNGVCNLGFCAERTLGPGAVCTTDAVCAGGGCNFGFCVQGGSLGDGHPCTTGKVCERGVCNFGFCTGPVENDGLCGADENCVSGVCNLGVCIPEGAVPTPLPCTSDGACEGGYCAGLFIEPGKLPLPGLCQDVCGDGSCNGAEVCGFSNVALRCLPDCGLCPAGEPCLTHFDCGSGICNFGLCSAGGLSNGQICSTSAACTSGICNFGLCTAGGLLPGTPCTTGAACRSGNCTAGFCIQRCGDGFCDGAEFCGDSNEGLQCQSDCGKCGAGTPCLTNGVCASNACNFGFCVNAASLPALTPCTTGNACRSGSCPAGLCAQVCGDGFCDGAELCGSGNAGLQCQSDCGGCKNGTLCTSNAVCASNACNFGVCVGSGSVGVGGACTTANACSNDICQIGCCGRPATAGCTQNSQCCSNRCVTDFLGNRSCALF